jgi:1-acyl-sn-glycerol-3-phosphate acyltransferase
LARALDWIFTVPFLLAFGLSVVVFEVLQRAARLFGQRPQEVMAASVQWSIWQSLRLCGTRFAVERSPLVRSGEAYILVGNHQSMFDVATIGGLLFRSYVKYVAKKELARGVPSISYNLREGGNAVIDRKNREQAVREIRALGARAQAWRVAVMIYPEGTRARDGVMKEWKPTGLLELMETAPDLPIVPVAIDESWKLERYRMRPVPFGTRVRVRIGDPIPRSPGEDRPALLARVESEVRRTVEGWRSEATRG